MKIRREAGWKTLPKTMYSGKISPIISGLDAANLSLREAMAIFVTEDEPVPNLPG
jgi:hypothetical protein